MSPFPLTLALMKSSPSPMPSLLFLHVVGRYVCFCSPLPSLVCSLATVCNVALTGATRMEAGPCGAASWQGTEESKADKVWKGEVASCSPDGCQEPHICLWSMGTGSWCSTCTENQFQTSSLNKGEPYEILQRQISGWRFTAMMTSRTYCHPLTYGSHMQTQSITTKGVFIVSTFSQMCLYNSKYGKKSRRKDQRADVCRVHKCIWRLKKKAHKGAIKRRHLELIRHKCGDL